MDQQGSGLMTLSIKLALIWKPIYWFIGHWGWYEFSKIEQWLLFCHNGLH